LIHKVNRWLVIIGARSGPAADPIDLLTRELAAGQVDKRCRDNLERTPNRKVEFQPDAT
jgi:hypothetical protein